jgi:DNA-binding NarL/FixJ family response regulator
MKVLIAEEDPKLRYAISILAQEQKGWSLAGVVDTIEELIRIMVSDNPDLVILDMDMVGENGSRIEERAKGHVQKIIFLVSTTITRKPWADSISSDRIWISKTESPENLVEIFNCFNH